MGEMKSIDQVLEEMEPTVDSSKVRSLAPRSGAERAAWWCERRVQVIYLIQANLGTPYKIGIARDVDARLRTLQTGNPCRLSIVNAFPGGQELEVKIHRALKDERLVGEWFWGELTRSFVASIDDHSASSIDHFGSFGRKIPFPDELLPNVRRRSRRHGMKSAAFPGNALGHRWRTSTGEQNPVQVRFDKPAA